jgi:hypothetical protein
MADDWRRRKERKKPLSSRKRRDRRKHAHAEWVKRILEQKLAKEQRFDNFQLPQKYDAAAREAHDKSSLDAIDW